MREHIRIYTSFSDEKKPEHQRLYRKLRREIAIERAGEKAKKYLREMTGRSDVSDSILYLFTTDGEPPPRITQADLKQKHKAVYGHMMWLNSLSRELVHKLEKLDAEQWEADQREIYKKERELQELKETIYKEYAETHQQLLPAQARKYIRLALQREERAKELKRLCRRTPRNTHILMLRQIEIVMRYLFSDYIDNPLYIVTENEKEQYRVIKEEVEIMETIKVELRDQLIQLERLIESAKTHLR